VVVQYLNDPPDLQQFGLDSKPGEGIVLKQLDSPYSCLVFG
jgi:hypothetical protein